MRRWGCRSERAFDGGDKCMNVSVSSACCVGASACGGHVEGKSVVVNGWRWRRRVRGGRRIYGRRQKRMWSRVITCNAARTANSLRGSAVGGRAPLSMNSSTFRLVVPLCVYGRPGGPGSRTACMSWLPLPFPGGIVSVDDDALAAVAAVGSGIIGTKNVL